MTIHFDEMGPHHSPKIRGGDFVSFFMHKREFCTPNMLASNRQVGAGGLDRDKGGARAAEENNGLSLDVKLTLDVKLDKTSVDRSGSCPPRPHVLQE